MFIHDMRIIHFLCGRDSDDIRQIICIFNCVCVYFTVSNVPSLVYMKEQINSLVLINSNEIFDR